MASLVSRFSSILIGSTSDPDLGFIRDEDMWFSDGTIILRAEHMIFRVYTGVLSKASSVFEDMLSADNMRQKEIIEGCPLVFMEDDTAADMRTFLQTLHASPASPIGKRRPALSATPRILSVLRLSTKYKVSHLQQLAIEALQTWFPSNLYTFQMLSTVEDSKPSLACAMEVANVARETDACILLPSALLWCLIQAPDARELYDGTENEDGSPVKLLSKNRRIIFITRPSLESAFRERTFDFLFVPSSGNPGCGTPRVCLPLRNRLASVIISPNRFINPFYALVPRHGSLPSSCDSCRKRWISQNQRSTAALWEELPSIFELQPWDELYRSNQLDLDDHAAEMSLALVVAPSLAATTDRDSRAVDDSVDSMSCVPSNRARGSGAPHFELVSNYSYN